MKRTIIAFSILSISFIFYSCGSSTRVIPPLNFYQYSTGNEKKLTKSDSNIEVSLELVKLSDVYNYPQLFSFSNLELEKKFPMYKGNLFVFSTYPKDKQGRQWEDPFVSQDRSEQVLLAFLKVYNKSSYTINLRDMKAALVTGNENPISSLQSIDDLLSKADYYQREANNYLQGRGGLIKAVLPNNFYKSIVLSHKDSYKLFEELPPVLGPYSSAEGLLAFPIKWGDNSNAKISITYKDGEGGNFDFGLNKEGIVMKYNNNDEAWTVDERKVVSVYKENNYTSQNDNNDLQLQPASETNDVETDFNKMFPLVDLRGVQLTPYLDFSRYNITLKKIPSRYYQLLDVEDEIDLDVQSILFRMHLSKDKMGYFYKSRNENGSVIKVLIFDLTKKRFSEPERLASDGGDEGVTFEKYCWLLDINDDGKLDIVSRYYTNDNGKVKYDKLEASIFNGDKFVEYKLTPKIISRYNLEQLPDYHKKKR